MINPTSGHRKFLHFLPLGEKVANLLKSAGIVAVATGISLLSGTLNTIILVRSLNFFDYALYSLALAGFQTLSMLADHGVASATMNEARLDWQNPVWVSNAVRSGRMVRRRIYRPVFAGAFLVLSILFLRQGADTSSAFLLSSLVIGACFFGLEASLALVPLYLQQRVLRVQCAQLTSDAIRLLGAGVVALIRPDLFVVLIFLVFASAIQARIIKSGSFLEASDPDEIGNGEITFRILRYVKRISPVWIYACFSGFISVWIISAFGGHQQLAHAGGLGRLGALMAVSNVVYNMIVIPRFTRTPASAGLRRKFFLCIFALLALTAATVVPMALFPEFPLMLMGDKFVGLNYEFRISCLGVALSSLYAGIYALAMARGALVPPWKYLTSVVLWMSILFWIFNFRTLAGALWVGALTPLPGIFAYFYVAHQTILREPNSI